MEFIAYLKQNYSPAVVRDFEAIQQTARASGEPRPDTSTKRWTRQASPRLRRPLQVTFSGDAANRYLIHAVVLLISAVFVGKNAPGMIVVFCLAIFGIVALLMIKDAISSSIAFTIRSRSAHGSYQVTVRMKGAAWDTSAVARVLNLVSIALPPEHRAEYVEDQAANLLHTTSPWEWWTYLLGVVLEVPRVAWELYLERRRESTR
jgi:hypothetical protein